MDNYKKGLLDTIEFCDLIIANMGSHGIDDEKVLQAKRIREDHMNYIEKYAKLVASKENVPV